MLDWHHQYSYTVETFFPVKKCSCFFAGFVTNVQIISIEREKSTKEIGFHENFEDAQWQKIDYSEKEKMVLQYM